MNFETMVVRVRQTASIPVSDTAVVGEFVNEAIRDFARDAATNPSLYSVTLMAGTRVYNVDGLLRVLPLREGETPDIPYNVRGLTTIELDAAPATTGGELTFWGVQRPAPLTGAAAIPFPEEYHRAIRYRALQLVLEWDRQHPEDVAQWEAKYEMEVQKAKRQRSRMQRAAPLRPSRLLGGGGYSGGLVLD